MRENMDWDNCLVLGCKNKCCLALKSKFCYVHTVIAKNKARTYFEKILKQWDEKNKL